MRYLLFAIIALALAGCASTPSQPVRSVTIEEIKPRYIPEENFKRIREYWTGAENLGNRVVLRSDPSVRDGFYFTLVLDENVRDLPRGTVINGEFYTPVSPEPQVHRFTLPNRLPRTREVFVGLTGADWPEPGGMPGAWRFTIEDPNGTVLAQKQSYLWSM